MREETQNWWKQSIKDLNASKNSINSGDYEWASFQANQSAEKALKALFLETKKTIVPSHNLISLAKMLKAPENIMNYVKDLNAEYIQTRYPDAANAVPYENYNKQKSDSKVKSAEKILEWTKNQLKL